MLNAAIRDIDTLTPETALKCRLFLERSKAAGLEVFVTETRRSSERQAALYAMGRSQPGRIVTRSKAGTGKHEFGLAFDVAFKGANLYPSDSETWERLGSIGKRCGLAWGGDFKGVDSVHFENNGGSIMGDIEAGAAAPVVKAETAAVAAPAAKVSKLPTLKSASLTVAIPVILMVLPAIAYLFPQFAPVIAGINVVAKAFGYGV
ncbi:MAG: M15 family metallopeptidase [Methylococcales bacterium]